MILIPENYTASLKARVLGLGSAVTGLASQPSNDTLYQSTVHVSLDMTNQQVGFTLQLR